MKGFMQKKGIEKRLIALWLVFVMMLTPVITNLGGKKGTKAAGEITATYTQSVTMKTAISGKNDSIEIIYEGARIKVNADSQGSTISRNADSDIYMRLGDKLKFKVSGADINTDSNYSNGYKVYSSESDIKQYINSVDEFTHDSETPVNYYTREILFEATTKYLALYTKYDDPTDTIDVYYSLTDVIRLTSADELVSNSITCVKSDDTALPTSEYCTSSVKVKLDALRTSYTLVTEDGLTTEYKVYVQDNNQLVDLSSTNPYEIPLPESDTKTHDIKVGLRKDDGAGSQFYGKTYDKTINLAMDYDAPSAIVKLVKVESGTKTEVEGFDNSVTDTPFDVENGTYYYKINVTDAITGVYSVTYAGESISEDTSEPGIYYIASGDFSSSNNKLTLIDNAGNSKEINGALRQVRQFVTDKKLTVEVKENDSNTIAKLTKTNDDVETGSVLAGNLSQVKKCNSNVKLNISVDSGKKIYNVKITTRSGNKKVDGTDEAWGVIPTIQSVTPSDSDNDGKYNYSYDFSNIELGVAGHTVEYSGLKVVVTYSDSSEQEIVLGNLLCDNVKPFEPTVTLQRQNGDGVWDSYTSSYIDATDSAANYRYYITGIADDVNGSGIDSTIGNSLAVTSGNTWSSEHRGGGISPEGSGYVYSFSDSDMNEIGALADEAEYVNYIVIKDIVGNEIYKTLTGLKKLDRNIKFSTIVLKDASGTSVKFDSASEGSFDSNLAIGEGYKLYITVVSGYELDSDGIVLRKDSDNGSITDFTLSSNTSSLADGRYTTELVFDMPAGSIGTNELYDNITLYVKDKATTPNTKSVSLGRLIYDNSRPRVEKLEFASGWVKESEATLTYEVVAGSQSVESVLAKASYTLAGQVTYITPAALNTTGEKTVVMPETTDPVAGTKITFDATDNAGNTITDLDGTKPFEATMFVDGHSPIVSELTVDSKNTFTAPLGGIPTISTSYTDNLALGRIDVTVTYPNGVSKVYTKSYDAYNGIGVNVSDSYSFQVDAVNGKAADGNYNISVVAYDKAGNKSVTNTIAFTVDNTLPVVNLAISGGTKGGKQPRPDGTDYYYSSNVPVSLEVEETNFTLSGVTVTDKVGNGNAKPVTVTWSKLGDKYVASMSSASEGHHVVTISAKDATGNTAVSKSVNFCIDKSDPGISLTLNGLAYQESRGTVDLTSDAAVSASVTDMTEDKGDFNIQIIQTKPDQPVSTPAYVKTGSRSFGFSEEADYTVNLFAVDMANNKSAVRTVSFRVDKTAPDLTISGAAGGGTSANAATVTFTMKEAFWWDAGGQVTIYKKAGDGKEEALLKTIDVKPTAFETSVSETLADTGVYRFEFTGYDRVGHRVETTQSFTIDRDAPVVTLAGVANYDMTTENVLFQAEIMDDFYASKSVSVTGTVTDINGKVEKLTFNPYTTVANPTVITQEFADDGIYDIEVSSTDAAGNSHSSKVHFVIDKTAPEIGDLSAFDGTILKSFVWDIDLDDLVSDLTVCDTHMYLNGSEYDGVSDIEDGSYTLLITAEDELGHMVEKSVSFILDTKAPVFIVTGVEDGEAKLEPYDISVSLQLDEDTLTSVTLNGEAIEIVDNTASLNVSENGHYKLAMKAVDEAGNEAEQTISFTVGEEKKAGSWWVWLIIACGVVLVGAGIIIAVRKNSKEA